MTTGIFVFTFIIFYSTSLSIGHDLSRDVLELQADMHRMKEDMDNLRRENTVLKSFVLNETPGFSAYSSATQTLGAGQVVDFDGVITNSNGDYNSATGVFTSTYAGLYFFSINLRSDENILDAALMVNGVGVTAVRIRDILHSESNSLVIQLNKDDTVHVEATGTGSIYGDTDGELRASTFSGFLVQLITL